MQMGMGKSFIKKIPQVAKNAINPIWGMKDDANCNSPGIHHTWELIHPFSVPQHEWFSVIEIPILNLCNF